MVLKRKTRSAEVVASTGYTAADKRLLITFELAVVINVMACILILPAIIIENAAHRAERSALYNRD